MPESDTLPSMLVECMTSRLLLLCSAELVAFTSLIHHMPTCSKVQDHLVFHILRQQCYSLNGEMQMYNKFNDRRSRAINGFVAPVWTAIEFEFIFPGLRLLLDYTKMSLTSGKVRAADRDTLCTHPRTQHYTICASRHRSGLTVAHRIDYENRVLHNLCYLAEVVTNLIEGDCRILVSPCC